MASKGLLETLEQHWPPRAWPALPFPPQHGVSWGPELKAHLWVLGGAGVVTAQGLGRPSRPWPLPHRPPGVRTAMSERFLPQMQLWSFQTFSCN